MKKSLQLFPADEEFVRLFTKEKARLTKILGPMVTIEHIGSTAVSGLGGKGIVDIMVGVELASELNPTASKLIEHGYFPDEDNDTPSDRIFLASKEHDSTLGDYHLHIVVRNNDEWMRLNFFRDELIRNSKLRDEYMKLKKGLFVSTGADREKYKKQKNEFIRNVLKEMK